MNDGTIVVGLRSGRTTSSLAKTLSVPTEITFISAQVLRNQAYTHLHIPLADKSCTLKRLGDHLILEGENDYQEQRGLVFTDIYTNGGIIEDLRNLSLTCTIGTEATGGFYLAQASNASRRGYVDTPRGKRALRYYDVDAWLAKNRSTSDIIIPLPELELAVINVGERRVEGIVNTTDGRMIITGLLRNIIVAYRQDGFRRLGAEDEYTKPRIYLKSQEGLTEIP